MTGEDRTTPHTHDRFLVSCSCGWVRPTELDRLRAIEDAARAAMDVADFYVDETETSPLWDDIPVELADKLVALRAALEGAPHE